MLASVALRTSIGSRRRSVAVQLQQVEGVQERLGLVPSMAQKLERSHSLLVTAHHLAVDHAGPHLEVVHGFHDKRVAARPVVPSAGDQPDAHRVAPGHEPVAVVLDLVDPIGARGRTVGRGWEAGLDKRNTRHVAYLGAGSQESSHPSRPSGRSPDMKRLSHWSQASAASCVSKRRMRSRRPSLHVSRAFQALPSSDLTTDQTA